MTEIVTEYCLCGGELEASTESKSAGNLLAVLFWANHTGEGHGKTTRPEMLNARDEHDRDPACSIRERINDNRTDTVAHN